MMMMSKSLMTVFSWITCSQEDGGGAARKDETGVPYTRGRVNLWIPDREGREALGALPGGVSLGLIPPAGELPAGVAEAEFLVLDGPDGRLSTLIGRMSRLRVIQTLSAGVDWLVPIIPEQVTLCDAAGARDAAVAEWVLAAILAATRSLGELRDEQRARRWSWQRSRELAGSTVLILGYGSIGAAVERRLNPFEVELIRVARSARPGVHPVAELGALLPSADIVVALLPLTPATAGLLDGGMLERMRPGALLVNAGRGPVLDSGALLELLRADRLRAVLDVTDPEPPSPEDPLWSAPNLLITPHFAGDTPPADRRAFALAGEQVGRFVRGEPLTNVVADGY
jgi:phosphoglycerate dehydrogenase-like enzyme